MKLHNKNQRPATPTFAFVVDGETEVWYLQMLQRNERQMRVKIKPEIANKKSLEDQYKEVKKLATDYTKVFWIIDFDTINKENNAARKKDKKPIEYFKEYREELKKEFNNVVIIVNNPCLEFWFLLHFEKTAKLFNNCKAIEKQLKKHLPDYEKKEKYFTKTGNDIYLQLKKHLKTALQNSKSLETFNIKDYNKAICEMFLLFTDTDLQKHFQQ